MTVWVELPSLQVVLFQIKQTGRLEVEARFASGESARDRRGIPDGRPTIHCCFSCAAEGFASATLLLLDGATVSSRCLQTAASGRFVRPCAEPLTPMALDS